MSRKRIESDVCFWCGKTITKKTQDHLFCKFVRERIYEDYSWIWSCYECNHEREGISSAFEILYRVKNNVWDGWGGYTKPDEIKVRSMIEKLDILKFRNKIEANIDKPEKRQACLLEIDEILKFPS